MENWVCLNITDAKKGKKNEKAMHEVESKQVKMKNIEKRPEKIDKGEEEEEEEDERKMKN